MFDLTTIQLVNSIAGYQAIWGLPEKAAIDPAKVRGRAEVIVARAKLLKTTVEECFDMQLPGPIVWKRELLTD